MKKSNYYFEAQAREVGLQTSARFAALLACFPEEDASADTKLVLVVSLQVA
jgi:hypothetical protein